MSVPSYLIWNKTSRALSIRPKIPFEFQEIWSSGKLELFVEWLAFWKLNNFPISWKLSKKIYVPFAPVSKVPEFEMKGERHTFLVSVIPKWFTIPCLCVWLLIGPLVTRLLCTNAIKDTASLSAQYSNKIHRNSEIKLPVSKGEMNSTAPSEDNGKRTYKDSEKSRERETTLEKQMAKLVPDDVRKAMAKLTLEEKQSLYLDIFKPLDFYELLFDRCFKNEDKCQPTTQN